MGYYANTSSFIADKRYYLQPRTREFLRAWYDWATNGAPDGEPFNRAMGLCSAAEEFDGDYPSSTYDDLKQCFKANVSPEDTESGLWCQPFVEKDYYIRSQEGTQHESPLRLAFVKANMDPD